MTPIFLLAAQLLAVALLVSVAWLLARRRLGARWADIRWGILAFPLSQVARFAVILPISALLLPRLGPAGTTVGVVLLVLTSGLFEETARWVVLRYWARRTRSWEAGVGFGLGHGGIEAILLVGASALAGIAMLAAAQAGALDPATMPAQDAAAMQAQLDALRAVTPVLAVASVYERILAICFHVAMSLLVLRGVLAGRKRLWVLAVALHIAFNTAAVLLAPATEIMAAGPSPSALLPVYAALTAAAAASVWAVWRGPLAQPCA